MQKNKSLFIDTEALSTLALVKAGLIAPVTKLMNKKEAQEVDQTKFYKGVPFPFAFILAPKGERNNKVLKNAERGEILDLICDEKKVGELIVEETFPVDVQQRLMHIYGTTDTTHPGVKNTSMRLGKIAVSGEYSVEYPLITDNMKRIKSMVEKTGATSISSIMLAANPLNRAHERMIRQALSSVDLLIIFLRKPFTSEGLRYDIRYNALSTFIDNFLPQNKVLVIPFENSYIFAGYNELILDALLAKNYGCNQLIVGRNHGGLGLYYDQNRLNTVFDHCKNIDIDIQTIDEFVYCDTCKTLVNARTCPHGQHHHVHYHSASIMQLMQAGLIPPSILVRKEVSANILAALFPDRFKNLQEMHYALIPSSGLLEQQSEEQFYLNLVSLYQTSSLT
ncbi:MAG TPA: sulfate adenylyltransferase [Sulfurovum sp.]|jgi:sulfate adenylyltransferase|nr:MAG: sulfate adenylyltransferase [Sulfurovum sp. 35-42-20]OYZ25908.1 MAG: sulfate adenylyltransferase [Sulfurovum sp. 16-42-52]OYZ48415.1 MAG: sulfate adenylyltransferase [Sulfurovum sp. 24-42-9]OZA46797.1 MAG: sulfate adenylyltransferase [Sulfurovum sp. 17-42-90]OZA60005.1 MAG: sulfate adenylyltransferase [Sulfurovum sp. 39-42-12]HQR73509.1 sulfate adenylyltransferase [Sulfurovum sp.]